MLDLLGGDQPDAGRLTDGSSFAEAAPSNSERCAALKRCCDQAQFNTAYLQDCKAALVTGGESECFSTVVAFVQQGACGPGFDPGPLHVPLYNEAGMLLDGGTLTDAGRVSLDATVSHEAGPPRDAGHPRDTGTDTTVPPHDAGPRTTAAATHLPSPAARLGGMTPVTMQGNDAGARRWHALPPPGLGRRRAAGWAQSHPSGGVPLQCQGPPLQCQGPPGFPITPEPALQCQGLPFQC